MREYKSEFGKGLVICLVKFAEHTMKFQNDLDLYKKMREEHENMGLFEESSAISLWANGASDHLYEIEVPVGEDWNEIRVKVDELKDKGLDMGHGRGLMGGIKFDKGDVDELFSLTRDIALMIDKKLGLEVELGEW